MKRITIKELSNEFLRTIAHLRLRTTGSAEF